MSPETQGVKVTYAVDVTLHFIMEKGRITDKVGASARSMEQVRWKRVKGLVLPDFFQASYRRAAEEHLKQIGKENLRFMAQADAPGYLGETSIFMDMGGPANE